MGQGPACPTTAGGHDCRGRPQRLDDLDRGRGPAPRDDAALESFIANVTNKSSAEYGQYLAPGAFAAEFGPLPSTISAVEQAVQADGLSVTGVSSDGLLVDFSGTAAQAETTFDTHLESYHMKAGWTGRGTTEPVQLQLPAALRAT